MVYEIENTKTFGNRVSLDRKSGDILCNFSIYALHWNRLSNNLIDFYNGCSFLIFCRFVSFLLSPTVIKPKYLIPHYIYITSTCWEKIFVPIKLSNLHLCYAMMAFTARIFPSSVKTTKQRTSSKQESEIRDDFGHKTTTNASSVR